MLLNRDLFDRIVEEASQSPRLRMNYNLRDSEEEGCQRMLNVLLTGTKTPIHRHQNTSEVVLCIYGSDNERFYDEQGNETEVIHMAAGSDTPGVVVEKGHFHSLESTDEIGVVCSIKVGQYTPVSADEILF